jgi:hypothetical protein
MYLCFFLHHRRRRVDDKHGLHRQVLLTKLPDGFALYHLTEGNTHASVIAKPNHITIHTVCRESYLQVRLLRYIVHAYIKITCAPKTF